MLRAKGSTHPADTPLTSQTTCTITIGANEKVLTMNVFLVAMQMPLETPVILLPDQTHIALAKMITLPITMVYVSPAHQARNYRVP